jgi:hypothetical protein
VADDCAANRAGGVVNDRRIYRCALCSESVFTDRNVNVLEHTLEPVVATVPPGLHAEAASAPVGERTSLRRCLSLLTRTQRIRARRLRRNVCWRAFGARRFVGNWRGLVHLPKRPLLQMPRVLENKYYVDEIYDAA